MIVEEPKEAKEEVKDDFVSLDDLKGAIEKAQSGDEVVE
jgi:hypothetical protein